jgi:hypothetical protein
MCSARRRKGPSVCSNELTLDVERTDRIVLDEIRNSVLSPRLVNRIRSEALAEQEPRADLEAEVGRLASEIGNLTKAIALGGDIAELVEALRERKRDLSSVEARNASRIERPNRKALREAVERRCDEWRDVLRSNVIAARALVRELFGKLHVHSEPRPRWVSEV